MVTVSFTQNNLQAMSRSIFSLFKAISLYMTLLHCVLFRERLAAIVRQTFSVDFELHVDALC